MSSAWALEVAPIKGVASIVDHSTSPWVHLFIFCFDLVFGYYTARYPLVDLDHSNVSTYLLLYLPDSSDLQEEELIAYKLLIHLSFKICPQNNAPSSPTFRLSIYTSMPAIKVLMPLPALTSTKAFSASSNFTVSVINFLTSTLPDATSPTASL